tara:strand:- start:1153 stop:1446 length:294 start_codon:yes stop_codon:yes gene_type:complete
MELVTILIGLAISVIALLFLIVSILMPFYVRSIMITNKEIRNHMQAASINARAKEHLDRATLTAVNNVIQIVWDMKEAQNSMPTYPVKPSNPTTDAK